MKTIPYSELKEGMYIPYGNEVLKIEGFGDERYRIQGSREYFSGETLQLAVHLNGEIRQIELRPTSENHFSKYSLKRMRNPSSEQLKNFEIWRKRKV